MDVAVGEGPVEPDRHVAGGAGVRLGQEQPVARRSEPRATVGLADVAPDQLTHAAGGALDRAAVAASLELEQEDRGGAAVAGMPGRFVEERGVPVGTGVELVWAPGPITVVDRVLASRPRRGALDEGGDARRRPLVVPVVGEDEARRPAAPGWGRVVAIGRFSH